MGRKKNKQNFTKAQIFFGLLGGMLLLGGGIASLIGLCTGNVEAIFGGGYHRGGWFLFYIAFNGGRMCTRRDVRINGQTIALALHHHLLAVDGQFYVKRNCLCHVLKSL